MVDIASLAIQIDTSDVARAEKDLDRLGNRGANAEKNAKKLGNAYKQASGDVAKVGDASKKSATGLDRLETRGNAAERSAKKVGAAYGSASSQIEKVGRESKKAADSVDDLADSSGRMAGVARSLGPAIAGMITLETLRRSQQLAEEYSRLQARVARVSESADAAAIAYSQLTDIARRSGSDLGETVRLWEALDRSLGELGANDAQIMRLTDTLQKVGTIGGSSAEEMSNALRQLEQGLASGVIRAEEFNSVLEGMPELAMQIAKGLGVPFADLRQLMLDGKLTAEDVLTSLQDRAHDIDREFAKLPRTVAQAGAALRNDLGGALSDLDKAVGASSNLAWLIDSLAKGIRFTAGDLTDQERLNQLVQERADLERSYEQAKRRTLLSSKEQASYEENLKRISGEIGKIQDRRVQQLTDEGKQLQSNTVATNEGLEGLREQAKLAGMSALEREKYLAVQKLGANATAEERAEAEKLAAETYRLTEARKGSLKATDEQARAFKALYDSLYPAEAAQRQYNEQVARLDKYLDGDQLAKAIDRLNHSLEGADATGPGDVIEDYRKELQRLEDQLDPVGKATSQYQKDVERLNDAMERGERSPERTAELLAELERQYKDNTKAISDWAKWTEGALDRVDAAFADAWRNIGDGFSSFRDSLTNAFSQMLAELAHMAITRPIVLQVGAAIGIGGGAGQVSSMLGSGSVGGLGFGDISNAFSLYQASQGQGFLGSVWSGYQAGGLSGAWSGVTGYGSGLLSGIDASAGQLYGTLTNGASATYAPLSYQAQVGGWSEITQGAAPWLSGLGGAYMGYQNAGLKGAVAGGAGGYAGAQGGAYIGTMILPGIGTAVGAVLGGILGSSLGSSIFGGDWQTKDVGLALSVNDGDFLGQQFEYQKKNGGLFSSDKKRTLYSALDAETAAALQQTFDATEAGVAYLFESLSYSVEEGALDGLQMARKEISTKGKTEEEIQEAIIEWFGSAADAMTAELNEVFSTGLDLDFEGMQAFVGNLQGVNEVLRYLDVGMYDASVSGGKLAEALSAAAGGLEALAANSQTYYAAFFSEAEKVEDTIDSIKRTFESADVELAASREAYRAMVEDIDLTTEAGQKMFATMMALSGQAAQYYSIIEQQAAQANALLIGSVNTAYAALQRSIAAQQRELQAAYSARVGSLNDMAATASANLSGMTSVASSLDAALKRLRGTSDDAVRMLRAQAVMTLNSALVTARAGGSLAGFEGLQDALDVASQMDTAMYGSLEDFEREQGRTANLVAELEKVNGKQLTTEENLLRSVQDQLKTAQQQYEADVAGLDAQLAYAQAQLDALNGIDNSIMGVAAAIAAMNASVVAALGAMPKGAAQANTPQNNRSIIDTIYQSVLGRGTEGDEAGAAFWANALQNGTATYQDIAVSIAKGALGNSAESAATKKSAEEYLKGLGIPGFASGGIHLGGARIVGENGPELEVTGPSRIYNASQTAAMLGGGGDTASEVRGLRADFAGMMDALRSVAKHTMQTAKRVEFLERWDYDGLPKERGAA